MPGSGDTPKHERGHPRYEVDIRVDWSTGRMFVSDHVTNISEDGAFLQSARGLGTQAEVEMVLWLPGRTPIRARGHVVWSQDAYAQPAGIMPGGGLRFTEMHPADRAMLREYLDEVRSGNEPVRGH